MMTGRHIPEFAAWHVRPVPEPCLPFLLLPSALDSVVPQQCYNPATGGGHAYGAAISKTERLSARFSQGGNHGGYIRSIGLPVTLVGHDHRCTGGLAHLPNDAVEQGGRSALPQ